MLKKRERLSREAFNRFFSVGRRHHTPSLQLVYAKTDDFHASVVVSKKVKRGAVERNKLRRQIYEIIRNHHRSTALTGVFIVITKPKVSEVTYAALKGELEELITGIQKIR